MSDDVRRVIYGTLVLFLLVVVGWVTTLLLFSCGVDSECRKADQRLDRTSVPTLIPHTKSEDQPMQAVSAADFDRCQVAATELVGAWVTAGSPNTEAFPFTDLSGKSCEGTFAEDIQPLFTENSLWYTGAIGCIACHNSELTERSGGLDLTSYDAILQGSGRSETNPQGHDILGGGVWSDAVLYKVLVTQGFEPAGHSASNPPVSLVLYAGHAAAAEATPTATP